MAAPSPSLVRRGMSARQPGSVSICCAISKFVESIQSRLDDANRELFRQSCFGMYTDMATLKFDGMVAYLALLHLVDGPPDSLKFRFGNHDAHFGSREYFLMTGLKFGPTIDLPSTSQLHRVFFGGKDELFVSDLDFAFDSVCVARQGSGDLALKLALLLFVYCVLFPVDSSSGCRTPIDLKYVHAVDNLPFFYNYPWGLVSFRCFVDQVRNVSGELFLSLRSASKPHCRLLGFAHVLTHWVYECLPSVGQYCTTLADEHELLFPRMVWRTSSPRKFFKDVKVLFKNSPGCPLNYVPLILTELEEAMLRCHGSYFTAIQVCSPAAVVPPPFDEEHGGYLVHDDDEVDFDEADEDDNIDDVDDSVFVVDDVDDVDDSIFDTDDEVDSRFDVDDEDDSRLYMDVEDDSIFDVDDDDDSKFGGDEVDDAELDEGTSHGVRGSTSDPVRRLVFEAFDKWFLKKSGGSNSFIETPMKKYPVISTNWFDTVKPARSCLNKLNCDVLLNFLLVKAYRGWHCCSTRWTIFDSHCWDVIRHPPNSSEPEQTIEGYVLGRDLVDRPYSFFEVDKIYGIAEVWDKKYSAYCIFIVEQKIVVYDATFWPRCKDAFLLMSSLIGRVCKKYNLLSNDARRGPWEVVLFDGAPRQPTDEDGGIMCVRVIECLITGVPLPKFSSMLYTYYRDLYCSDLYSVSVKL